MPRDVQARCWRHVIRQRCPAVRQCNCDCVSLDVIMVLDQRRWGSLNAERRRSWKTGCSFVELIPYAARALARFGQSRVIRIDMLQASSCVVASAWIRVNHQSAGWQDSLIQNGIAVISIPPLSIDESSRARRYPSVRPRS